MGNVKIINGQQGHPLHKFMNILGVCLGVLTGLIIIFSYENPSITGYSVFNNVYGSASPAIIIFLLFAIIYMYLRVNKN